MRSVFMTLANPGGTGGHRMAHEFALALLQRGYQVCLAHGPASSVAGESLMHTLSQAGAACLEVRGLDSLASPALVHRLAREALSAQAGCLIGFNQSDRKFAIWASRRARLPCVISVQNQHRFYGPAPLRWLKARAYATVIRKAHLLVCTSQVVQSEMISRFGVASSQTRVLPNGIEVERFSVLGARGPRAWEALGVKADDVLVANLGRLHPQKGQDLLIQALARVAGRHPTLRLGLIGNASDSGAIFEQRLRDLVVELELTDRVVFAGWRDDIPQLLSQSDLYLHSARWEGPPGGLAVLEAMACGLPTGYTDCSGRLDSFEDGVHGLTLRTESVDSLAEGLHRLASLSSDERKQMGLRARQLVEEHYDIRRVIAPAFVALVEQAGCWNSPVLITR